MKKLDRCFSFVGNVFKVDIKDTRMKAVDTCIFVVNFEHVQHVNLMFTFFILTQPAFTCSKLTIEKLEQGVKYVKS